MSERAKLWEIVLLGGVLLLACTTPPEPVPSGGGPDTAARVLLNGKRFKPSGTRAPAQSPKSSGSGSAETETRGTPRPARVTAPSYKLGESDGGPGQWEKAPVRPKGTGYQKEITGAPEGVEYAVPSPGPTGKVLFDGYKHGKLLDAKDWERWPPADTVFWEEGIREDAEKQLKAARGTPIEWHFPNEDKAQAVRTFFRRRGINGIDVKVTPKK